MDTLKCLCFLLIGILHFQKSSAQSACVQNLAQNEDFMRCTQSFMGIMQEMQGAGAAGSMSDPAQMYSVFCSPEGKAAMQCLMNFVFECPEVKESMAMGGDMGLDFSAIMSKGGIDVFCELMTGGCAPILAKCTNQSMDSMMGGEGGMMMGGDSEPRNKRGSAAPYSGPTPYSVLPTQMASICGPMREMLTCIIGAMDQCPKTAVYMEEILEKMSAKSNEQGGPDMPTYAESRKYILESCPKLPEDFTSKQQCLSMSVGRPEFVACYQNVTDHKKTNCDLYFGGKKCLMMHVGEDCGEPYAKVMAQASPLFSKEIPSQCESGPAGGVSSLQASIITMIVAGILSAWKL